MDFIVFKKIYIFIKKIPFLVFFFHFLFTVNFFWDFYRSILLFHFTFFCLNSNKILLNQHEIYKREAIQTMLLKRYVKSNKLRRKKHRWLEFTDVITYIYKYNLESFQKK
jgi:hypothetical protein